LAARVIVEAIVTVENIAQRLCKIILVVNIVFVKSNNLAYCAHRKQIFYQFICKGRRLESDSPHRFGGFVDG